MATSRLLIDPARALLAAAGIALLAACGGGATPAAPMADVPQPAPLAIGDATAQATVIRTADIPDAMAAQYGIARGDDVVMLLVSVRRPSPTGEATAPATVTARTSDLQGRAAPIALRELRIPDGAGGTLVDHVGTFEVSPPETLRFDVAVTIDGRAPATLQFTRDFRPAD